MSPMRSAENRENLVSAGGLNLEEASPGGFFSTDFLSCGFEGVCLRFFGLALGTVGCASRAGRAGLQ